MYIENPHRDNLHSVSIGHQILMFIGFVAFITGLFSFAYSLLAWYLLAFSKNILLFALVGLLAAYLGRRILRRGRIEVTL